MKFVFLQTDSKVTKVYAEYLVGLPYFATLFREYPDEKQYLLDMDYKSLQHVIDMVRNDDYDYPTTELSIWQKLNTNEIDRPNDFIKINVSDVIFYSTKRTLVGCDYFRSLFNFVEQPSDYLDRNSKVFRHILYYLRNSEYVIPQKYSFENNFFGVHIQQPKINRVYEDNEHRDVDTKKILESTNLPEVYLSGNPQVTFFKTVYRRHTRFAVNNEQTIGSQNDDKVIFTINNGDLLSKMALNMSPINCPAELSDIIDIKFLVGEIEIGCCNYNCINLNF